MNPIIERLDKIATDLESKGYIKEATEIDVISNTIERLAFVYRAKGNPVNKEDYQNQGDPLYGEIEKTKELLQKDKKRAAYDIISRLMKPMVRKKELYGTINSVKIYHKLYLLVLKAFIEDKLSNKEIIVLLNNILSKMEESERDINQLIQSKLPKTEEYIQTRRPIYEAEPEPYDQLVPARNSDIPS